jgi:hypothetical protein
LMWVTTSTSSMSWVANRLFLVAKSLPAGEKGI